MSVHDLPDAARQPGDTSGKRAGHTSGIVATHEADSMRLEDDAPFRVDLVSFEPSTPLSRFTAAIRSRMVGPGGYYNLGNALGLVTGVTLQIVAVPPSSGLSGLAALLDYFAGSVAAMALTLATLLFFYSGEIYCRAWARKPAPDASLNRLGDMLSGVGAIGLGIALFLFGEPVLAATSGLLHALGKFGSAFEAGRPLPGWPATWPNPFRSAVLASRVPAILAAAAGIVSALPLVWSGASWTLVAAPLTLLVCYLLWAKADLLLFQEGRAESALASPSGNHRDGV